MLSGASARTPFASAGCSSILAPERRPRCTASSRLMEFQASRSRARLGARTESPVPLLLKQDRSRCGPSLLNSTRAGGAAVRSERAWVALSAPMLCRPPSPLATRALRPRRKPTGRVSPLSMTPWLSLSSPIVDLNRAVAIGMAYGPASRPGPRRQTGSSRRVVQIPPASERARRFSGQARQIRCARARVLASRGIDAKPAREGVASSPERLPPLAVAPSGDLPGAVSGHVPKPIFMKPSNSKRPRISRYRGNFKAKWMRFPH